jgi:hypothetical protein
MLFANNKHWWREIQLSYDYFEKWKKLEGGMDWKLNPQSQEAVLGNFNYYSGTLTGILKDLEKDVKETKFLEQGLEVISEDENPAMMRGGGGSNKRKNVRTRRRVKLAK